MSLARRAISPEPLMGRLVVCLGWLGVVVAAAGWASDEADFPPILTLQQALEMMDTTHPQLQFGAAQVLETRTARDAVHSWRALDVAIEGEFRTVDPAAHPGHDFVDDSRIRLVVDKPLIDFGAAAGLGRARTISHEAAEEQYRLLQAEQRIRVIAAFLGVIKADYLYIARDEQMTVAFLDYDRAREQQELFDDRSPSAVARLQSVYLNRLAVRRQAQQGQRLSRLQLAVALNRAETYPDQMVEPELDQYARPVPEYEVLLEQFLHHGIEMKIARSRVEAARGRLAAIPLQGRPRVGVRLEAADYARATGGNRDVYRGALYVSAPLLQKQKQRAETGRAAADLAREEAALADLEHRLRVRVLEMVQRLAYIELEIEAAQAELNYHELDLDKIRLEYEMELRARLGAANARVAGSLHRLLVARYERVIIWERIDAYLGATPTQF